MCCIVLTELAQQCESHLNVSQAADGECVPRLHTQGNMRGLMTISVSGDCATRRLRPLTRALVITSLLAGRHCAGRESVSNYFDAGGAAAHHRGGQWQHGVRAAAAVLSLSRPARPADIARLGTRRGRCGHCALRTGRLRAARAEPRRFADRSRSAARAGVRAADHARELRG